MAGSNGAILHTINGSITGIAEHLDSTLPQNHALHQNYPNPFNPVTVIRFDLAVPSDVDLTIYNLDGRVVANPVSGFLGAGVYRVRWDAAGHAGGRYFYRLRAGDYSDSKVFILIQ